MYSHSPSSDSILLCPNPLPTTEPPLSRAVTWPPVDASRSKSLATNNVGAGSKIPQYDPTKRRPAPSHRSISTFRHHAPNPNAKRTLSPRPSPHKATPFPNDSQHTHSGPPPPPDPPTTKTAHLAQADLRHLFHRHCNRDRRAAARHSMHHKLSSLAALSSASDAKRALVQHRRRRQSERDEIRGCGATPGRRSPSGKHAAESKPSDPTKIDVAHDTSTPPRKGDGMLAAEGTTPQPVSTTPPRGAPQAAPSAEDDDSANTVRRVEPRVNPRQRHGTCSPACRALMVVDGRVLNGRGARKRVKGTPRAGRRIALVMREPVAVLWDIEEEGGGRRWRWEGGLQDG